MVNIQWVTRITGVIDSSDAVFNPRINTTTFGEIVYSQTIANNTSGEDKTISFKTRTGTEAFTLTFPDGEHNIFWKTDANGTPLWGFVVSNSDVSTTLVDSEGNLFFVTTNDAPILLFNSSGALAETVALQGGASSQTLIVKYNSSGIFQWVIRMGSNVRVDVPRIQLDGDNNLYAIGDYGANVTILDADGGAVMITGGSNTDMFASSFNLNGETNWVAKMTGTDSEGVSSVEIYEDNIYISGAYKSDPMVLTPGTGSTKNFVGGVGPSGPVGYGITLALNKATGAYLWAVVFDAPADLRMITSQSDTSGVVIIGTIPSENVEIKNGDNEVIGEIVSEENALNGVFIVKMTHTGEYIWHVKVSGSGTEIIMSEDVVGGYFSGSILDSAGNVYLKAHFFGPGELSGVPQVYNKEDELIAVLPEESISDLNSLSVLLLQIKPNGTFGWITKIKPDIEREIYAFEMFIGSDDNLYLTGNASQSQIRLYDSRATGLSPATGPVKTITTNTTDFLNPIIFSYSNTGKYRWITHIQYPDFEVGPLSALIKQADTRLKRMNLLFNFFNSRLGLTPERRVYLNLVAFPGLNEFFVENKKVLTLEFDAAHPYILALDGRSGASDSDNMFIITVIILAIIAIGLIMFMRR